MSENIFNFDIPNRDITDVNTAAQKQEKKTETQDSQNHGVTMDNTYRFDFCIDSRLYSSSFKGRLTSGDIQGMFAVLHSCLYRDCPEAIQSYLEQQHLEYSHFKAELSLPSHTEIMHNAENLLRSCSCSGIDNNIGRTDFYYAVTDHQKQTSDNCCEGCYYAVQRVLSSKTYSYRIIGQIFSSDRYGDNQDGYFAIRSDDQDGKLHTLNDSSKNLVFPSFGCVDMFCLLYPSDADSD